MKSIKNNSPSKYYKLNLGAEFMCALRDKTLNLIKERLDFIIGCKEMIGNPNFGEQFKQLDEKISKVDMCIRQIRNMKSGNIALVKQITTISKMRIIDPVKDDDVLSGVRLSDDTLSAIDHKITEFFTKLNIDTQ